MKKHDARNIVEVHLTKKEIEERKKFIDDFFLNVDLYNRGYCGYWLCGVSSLDDGTWLGYESANYPTDASVKRALRIIRANRNGDPQLALPRRFFHLTRELGEKAFAEGVKRWGLRWFDRVDGNRYDVVVQLALLGEVRYG